MSKLLCRLCWNTSNWNHPSGNPKGERETFAARNGFGHEEWLNRSKWVENRNGWRYAFLQPFAHKKSGFVAGNLVLFTIDPHRPKGSNRLFVGTLRHCVRLSDSQAKSAFQAFKRQGWLGQMHSELASAGINAPISCNPIDVLNVMFKTEDLKIWTRPRLAGPSESVNKVCRYRLCRI